MQPENHTFLFPSEAALYDAIVVGAGQAGLAMGYYLKQQNQRFLLLEQSLAVGQTWRDRYDSLKLFTPAEYCALPGLPLSLPQGHYPTKDQIADYLHRYAQHFRLPVLLRQKVVSLTREGNLFHLQTTQHHFQARQVIVATGPFQVPFIPTYATAPGKEVVQVHSAQYRNAGQLPAGRVLVVGAGNSGAQIAVELSQTHEVHLSVKKPPRFSPLRKWGKSVFWWATKTGAIYAPPSTFLGRKLLQQNDVIYGHELEQALKKREITLRPLIIGFNQQHVYFEDHTLGSFESIVWATGFRPSYEWLQIPEALGPNGWPLHQQGISPVTGLFFLGLSWQRSRSSALLLGAGRDALFISRQLT
ncbi:hypothetical protein EFA69_01550 [Rufibacter immobilis]|uniref:FAD-binding protein n=1 Tax=Rufibacter immobilis TaxID=1348778 RepID=A0A3M9N5P9_9BACT|nr:NAD(P)/FAD-dependent oxidoreductase [Rufibacter immobilis]RNI33131.1 hypothetical protein EFA69_01550 [Rufibacter immobilis]